MANYICSSWAVLKPKCPCPNPMECKRLIQNPSNRTIGYIKYDPHISSNIHWDKLTIISLIDFHNDSLMCLAHRNKVQIISFANFTLVDVSNQERVDKWIEKRLVEAINHYYDGIDLFIDDPVEPYSTMSNQITHFVKTVTERFRKTFPGFLVLFNVPFSPYNEKKNGVDGKNYDYLSISKIVDLIVIMGFDQRSQIDFDGINCVAGASESLYVTIGGIMAYQQLGLDLNRVILTMGFYVDEYICIEYHQNWRCIIQPYSYRGSNCSSKVANRIPWNQYELMKGQCWQKVWDEHSNHDIYTVLDHSIYGVIRQYWSDYPAIWKRLGLIKEKKLNGLGVWMLNYLNENIWNQLPKVTQTIS